MISICIIFIIIIQLVCVMIYIIYIKINKIHYFYIYTHINDTKHQYIVIDNDILKFSSDIIDATLFTLDSDSDLISAKTKEKYKFIIKNQNGINIIYYEPDDSNIIEIYTMKLIFLNDHKNRHKNDKIYLEIKDVYDNNNFKILAHNNTHLVLPDKTHEKIDFYLKKYN